MLLRLSNLDRTETYDLLTSAVCCQAVGRVTTANEFNGMRLIEERFLLYGKGTETEIMNAIVSLNNFARKASLWHSDTKNGDSIWLEEAATNEADRRSLIFSITVRRGSEGGLNPLLNRPYLTGEIVITRHYAWESITPRTTTVTLYGGMWMGLRTIPTYSTTTIISSLTAHIYGSKKWLDGGGTLPSRINRTILSGIEGIDRIWLGIRPSYAGHSNFEPNNLLGDGTAGVDNVFGTIDFSTTPELAMRVSLTVENMSSTTEYNHYIGDYLVNLIYAVYGTALCGVQLAQNGVLKGDERFVEETTGYQVIELGIASFPQGTLRSNTSSIDIRNLSLEVYAERISGTGVLVLHSVTLIPITNFCKLEGLPTDTVFGQAIVYTHEDDSTTTISQTVNTTQYEYEPDTQSRNWYLPAEGGVLVAMGAQNDDMEITFSYFTIELEVYDRWQDYRGN